MALGRGKVILFGEHAVVHRRPAIAAAIERGVLAEAFASECDALVVEPWDVRIESTSEFEDERALLVQGFRVAIADAEDSRERKPATIRARVQLPASAGLGCSAALGVAVLGAFDEWSGRERSAEERAIAAFEWETVFHGNPSGIDNWMASCGGLALYRKGADPQRIKAADALRLVIGHSGEPGSTKDMVASVAYQQSRDPAKMEKIFDGMESIVVNARRALEDGDSAALGQLMALNQTLLSAILVSTDRLETLCRIATDAGAYGAKLTGGGGGGCMIALVDAASEEAVVKALDAQGAEPFVSDVAT